MKEDTLVDYLGTLDCIHCGLCLQTCPTFRLTGSETSSPRGRVHLMRAIAEERASPDACYAEELDFCLLCRRCESVCPAGVRFGEMMEEARAARENLLPRPLVVRVARWIGLDFVLPRRGMQRLAADFLRLLQRTGLARILARIAPRIGLGAAAALADLPPIAPRSDRPLLDEELDPIGARPEDGEPDAVFLLQGCVQVDLFPATDAATADVLRRLGLRVHVPRLACCGSLHAHNGARERARSLARTAIETFEQTDDPIVVNSAGCGSHLRELHHLFEPEDPWRERALRIAERTIDFSAFVAPRLADLDLPQVPPDLSPLTWDDPCHLCHGQGVRDAPRTLLAALANASEGVEVVPLPDSEACCGSAGIYSILRPADSMDVFASKLAAFRASGARTLVTSNPGCQLQWTSGLARAGETEARVLSLAELLTPDLSYRNDD